MRLRVKAVRASNTGKGNSEQLLGSTEAGGEKWCDRPGTMPWSLEIQSIQRESSKPLDDEITPTVSIMQLTRTLYSTYPQSQHITEEHNQGVATWFTRTRVSLMLHSHPKHEEALPTSRSSGQLKVKPPWGGEEEGQGRSSTWLCSASLGWSWTGGSPTSCGGRLAEKERSRDPTAHVLDWSHGECNASREQGNGNMDDGPGKWLQCRLLFTCEPGISCLLCLL